MSSSPPELISPLTAGARDEQRHSGETALKALPPSQHHLPTRRPQATYL
jgi:hypothetical protein